MLVLQQGRLAGRLAVDQPPGITPSYAFVGQPATNGVIGRFFRTLKEQVTHGRVFQALEDVRDAARV